MTTPQDPFGPPGENTPGSAGSGAGQPAPEGQPYQSPQSGEQPQYGQQPHYGQQQYGEQPYGSQPGGPKKNGLGIAALVLGILALVSSFSIVGGIVLGLAAIVLGFLARGKVKRGEADNGGMAIAGIVLGVLGLLAGLAVLVFTVLLFQSDSGQGLVDCLEQASGDAAAEQLCQQEFTDEFSQ